MCCHCLYNNWKWEHTSSASSASSSPCVLRNEITMSSSSSSSEYSDSNSSTSSSYLGVCTCGDEHQYINNTFYYTYMSLTPVNTIKGLFFFIQLNGQQGQNYTQGDRCASCTLHMRNRNRSVQKLVKLSHGRRHLVSQCSGPNVIWCQLNAMPRWNHKR